MPPDNKQTSPVVLVLEPSQCIGCAICVDICPSEALTMGRTDLTPRQITGRCTGCAICVRQCPTGAITLPRGPVGAGPR